MGLFCPSSSPYGSWPLAGLVGATIAICFGADKDFRLKFIGWIREHTPLAFDSYSLPQIRKSSSEYPQQQPQPSTSVSNSPNTPALKTTEATAEDFEEFNAQQSAATPDPPMIYDSGYQPLVKALGLSTPQTYHSAVTTRPQTPDSLDLKPFELTSSGNLPTKKREVKGIKAKHRDHITVSSQAPAFGIIDQRPFSSTSNGSTAESGTLLQDSDSEADHILFVCTKCQRNKVKDTCEEACSPNYFRCRMGNVKSKNSHNGSRRRHGRYDCSNDTILR